MKFLKKMPFFCLLCLSGILFTLCALLGRTKLYQNYIQEEDLKTTPILASVFEGLHDGIMPWEIVVSSTPPDHLTARSNEVFDASDAPYDTGGTVSESSEHAYPVSGDISFAVTTDTAASSVTDIQQADTMISSEPEQTVSSEREPTISPEPEPEILLGPDGLPVVNYITVDDSYFDDAIFIGDSRTRSLQLYAGLENATFLADTGLTIYTVLDKELTPSNDTRKTTVTDYLATHRFAKVYLMLGINELGTGTTESFCRKYEEVLRTIRELQPDAVIYLQAILYVSESKDAEGTYINNATICERNDTLKSLADNTQIYWLDANSVVCDENGFLIEDYTFDGVHLLAKYVSVWTDYLECHAVEIKESE